MQPVEVSGPRVVRSMHEAVERLVEMVGTDLVVGAPLGIGKPAALLDALLARARSDPETRLHLVTALTLARPRAGSELERRLLDPIADRLFEGCREPAWVDDRRADRLPGNVTISDFYFRPASLLDARHAQRDHVNTNYTEVTAACLARGINAVVQAVAIDGEGRLSLASNPDVTLELLRHFELLDRPTAMVGVVNHRMPFVAGDAVVSREAFDILVESDEGDEEPFPVPARPLSEVDHAIGLQAAALVPDGGTIQFGIGSLADAIAAALVLRHRDPAAFRSALAATGALDRHRGLIEELGGIGPFEKGLYACSEMLSDGILALYDAGILRRRALPDEAVQRLADAGVLEERIGPRTIATLREAGVISSPLGGRDLSLLRAIGAAGPCRIGEGGRVVLPDGTSLPPDPDDPDTVSALIATAPAAHLAGPVIHAAFFLGSRRFYERLRRLPNGGEGDLNMTSVGFTNSIDESFGVQSAQRRHARFLNQAMKVTASGDVAAHVLDDGRVVSGVGGQFDFVGLAHRLPGARSVTLVPSTHRGSRGTESNIVVAHPHVTIPAQHRDVVVTEYGIADLRHRTAGEVLESLVSIADARFHDDLVRFGHRTGRLPPAYRPPADASRNTREAVQGAIAPLVADGTLAVHPFGADLTGVELDLVRALRALDRMRSLRSVPSIEALGAGWRVPDEAAPHLRRMGLEEPTGLRETVLQRALVVGLVSAGIIEPSGEDR